MKKIITKRILNDHNISSKEYKMILNTWVEEKIFIGMEGMIEV